MHTNHTPGPWAVTQRSVGKRQTTVVLDADRNEVCEAYDSAALIAAAPDLLAALRQIEAATVDGGTVNTIARAAIARATGPTDDQFLAALGPCGK